MDTNDTDRTEALWVFALDHDMFSMAHAILKGGAPLRSTLVYYRDLSPRGQAIYTELRANRTATHGTPDDLPHSGTSQQAASAP